MFTRDRRPRRILAAAVPLVATVATVAGTVALGAAPASADRTQPAPANGLIAFSDDRDGNNEIYTVQPDGAGLQRLTNGAASDQWPSWSPDGQQIAWLRDHQLWVMDADGSDAHQVVGYAAGGGIAWSPDGSRLTYSRNGAIWVVDADGSDAREIVPQVNAGYDLESPHWSPDGTRIVFLRSTGPGSATVWSVAPDGTDGHEVAASFGRLPHWSPDGTALAYSELGLTVDGPDGVERIVFLNGAGEGTVDALDWAPDGERLVYQQRRYDSATGWTHGEVRLVDADGSDVTVLTAGTQPDWQPVVPVRPDTTVTGADGGWALTQPTLTFGSDVEAGFECRVDGGAWAACGSSYTPGWRPGDHGIEVRAVTEAGAFDETPAVAAWTTPYDDRRLASRGHWVRTKDARLYRGSARTATVKGARITLEKIAATELALVATTCPTCGKVAVYYGRERVATLSLRSAATRRQVVLPVGEWSAHRAADVRVEVLTSRRQVTIDGIGVRND